TGPSGVYAYERPLAELTAEDEALFRKNAAAWADWEKRPPSYRKVVLHWITSAKRPETRARRLATLIDSSAKGEKIPGYDIGKKQ
ncbi:MAG: YdeI/OmpD-associated family protein, partial [Sphingomicrobium sp.]